MSVPQYLKRDNRGVRRLSGEWRVPSRVLRPAGLAMLVLWTVFALRGFMDGRPKTTSDYFALTLLLALSLLAISHNVRYILICHRLRPLISAQEARDRLQVEKPALEQYVRTYNIRPHFNLNGEDYYDPRDFGEATTLLRAAKSPESESDILVRPAGNESTAPQELLRPTVTPPTAPTTEKEVQVQKSW